MKIEWTQKTWNPVTGCTPCSRGCENCYAMRMTKRLQSNPLTAEKYKNGTEVTIHRDELRRPHTWSKPSMIFVCSMSDLFHPAVPEVFISKLLSIITYCRQHTFQFLTKRPQRFAEYIRTHEIAELPKNLWVGTTIEDQEQADIRIHYLLKIPAYIRFISAEPLLGSIDIQKHLGGRTKMLVPTGGPKINWVIAGGETGPGARPMHPEWITSLRDQCQATDTPFFFKSWGGRQRSNNQLNGITHQQFPNI